MSGENLERKKALEMAMSQIEKQFGKGSVMKLGEFKAMEVEAIPTGALSLDIALGIGGVPRGRIIEIYGPESSGKTTLALHIIAEAQKMNGEAAFIDAEHALDPVYAKHLGVDIDNLLVSQPDTGEQALEITEALVRSGALDVVVVDSVAALVPKAEIDGDMGDSHMGLQARLMSQALRKLAGAINKSKTVLIFINQLREKIGVMFGNPETTTGGRALKFYASVRMDIRKIENIKQDGEITGSRARVKVVKNKVAPPFREAEFDIVYGKGISKEGNILDMAVNLDIIEKSGSWFSYDGNRIGQGRENVKRYLAENPDIMAEVEKKVRDNFEKAFEKSLGDEEENNDDDDVVVLVEDEEAIADLERDYLELSGFTVEVATDGDIGLQKALNEDYDLLILDLMLPGTDGFDICRQVRDVKNTPIVMVSAKKDDIDKIRGLGLGADDYMTKPFSPSELVARVKAHLARYDRLTGSAAEKNKVIEIRGLKIDTTARRVWVNGEERTFTTKEFDLLTFLASHPNHVYSKEELFREIWDMESIGDIATVTVHIKKIREKVEVDTSNPQYIETIWGVGYRFKV